MKDIWRRIGNLCIALLISGEFGVMGFIAVVQWDFAEYVKKTTIGNQAGPWESLSSATFSFPLDGLEPGGLVEEGFPILPPPKPGVQFAKPTPNTN